LGYIPPVAPGGQISFDVVIEVSGIPDDSPEGIVGWGLSVQFDPAVIDLSRTQVTAGTVGYFLWEFAGSGDIIINPGTPDPETGYWHGISAMIVPTPPAGAGEGYSGLKLLTLTVDSKSDTACSPIDLLDVEYFTADGMWLPADEVVDGQYNHPLHDVAVTGIGFHHSTVYGDIPANTTYYGEDVNTIYIDAEVFNAGLVPETVEVTFNYTIANVPTTVGVILVDVAAGSTEIASVELDTQGFPIGYLPITVKATEVLNEENILDNNMTTTLRIKHVGDVNGDTYGTPGDGDVDRYDFGGFAQAYGRHYGEAKYNVEADFDRDGIVDRYDFGIFAQNYRKTV
jgi:hypothetical protein